MNNTSYSGGPVVYWMSRDQRARDNWALTFASEMARREKSPLAVAFCLAPGFLGATIRHYGFMLRGLRELETDLRELGVPFFLLQGEPGVVLPEFLSRHNTGAVVTDFDPLGVKQKWKRQVCSNTRVPVYEVDAHNIVPCWIASDKHEYGAYTLRPKLQRALPEFLDACPMPQEAEVVWPGPTPRTEWNALLADFPVDRSVPEVDWIEPGENAAHLMMRDFLTSKLPSYPSDRSDPTKDGQSNLSPYLHFGQISAQRVAMEAMKCGAGAKEFLDELITWRELSDNFCYYVPDYTSFDAFPEWARKSLDSHRGDDRLFVYSLEEFEQGLTHDELWNACQLEMVIRGKMHGYMRMYWAKKILEWTPSPEDAIETAIYLNDKYELDGRDPNGYAGIAWAIGGVHDRPWRNRPVSGSIRYMSYNGCKSKFDVNTYIEFIRDMHESAA